MNKPAALALAAFAILGTLMWYAASNSMAQYLAEYQAKITMQLPVGSHFSLGDLAVNASEDSGALTSLNLRLPLDTNNQSNAQNHQVKSTAIEDEALTFAISHIGWQYEKRSLKKAVVQVTHMTIDSVSMTLPQAHADAWLTQLSTQLEQLITTAVAQQVGLMGRQEFKLNINQLTLDKLFITLTTDGEPSQEVIGQQLALNHQQLADEQQMSITVAYALQAIAKEAKQQVLSH
ncbi:hypothetical protein DXX93_04895 [Thalassotalea euphylliae]|uniref:DUF945 family protein n=1 Tax=Thalassotalea euphylliae TaxID=1655234 RepID=A0A3E0TN44_9GAMM|nr:hypothetical protein [Thalassotalea euphylliae]REL25964.1 hypothetical protein DXX93_04895 [Thalassotalea euphylliae]